MAKVLEFQFQHQSFQWLFRSDFLLDGVVGSPCSPRESKQFSPTPQFKSINSSVLSFLYSPTLTSYMTTGKTIALTKWTFFGNNVFVFNMLSRLVISFLPRSKHLLISRLQSPSAVILEPKKMKSVTVSIVSSSICHEVMGPDAMICIFECWVLSQLFHSPLSLSSRDSLVPLHFLPWGWCQLHIWDYWYFSRSLDSSLGLLLHLRWMVTSIRPQLI